MSNYVIRDHQLPHFITFSVINWIPGLSRSRYKDVVINILRYCQANKGLRLFAYVLMNDHVHLIIAAREKFNLSDILRDFKKFTSKKLIELIDCEMESRRNWMVWMFESAGYQNSNNKVYQFWQQDNHPIELSTNYLIDQRLNYLHNEPS